MTRIAAGLLVVGAVMAMTGMFPQNGFAAEVRAQPAPRIEVSQTPEAREGSRVLALLVALQALGAGPAAQRPKV